MRLIGKILVWVLFIGLFSTISAWASDCKISFSLSPAGSFVAESSAVQILGSTTRNGQQVSAQNVVLHLDTLKTGISLRDEHMKTKYLETQLYPDAILTHASGSGGVFQGELQIRNLKKPINGTYHFEGNEFVGDFKTKISDFGVKRVKYMGVGVNDEVNVEIRLPATPYASSRQKM